MRLTIACREALIPDARHLAMILGYGPADADTYREANWQDAHGNRYAVASTLVRGTFVEDATGPLTRPEWDADGTIDMDAARRAQAAVVLADPSQEGVEWRASPDRILAYPDDDALVALEAMGVGPAPEVEGEPGSQRT